MKWRNSKQQTTPLGPIDPNPWIQLLQTRFGIPPGAFEGYHFFMPHPRGIYIRNQDHAPPAEIRRNQTGLRLIRLGLKHPKLTTAGALLFGDRATRNVLNLNEHQLKLFLDRQRVPLHGDQRAACGDPGYVLLRYRDEMLGIALLLDENGKPALKPMPPRAWANVRVETNSIISEASPFQND